MRCSRGRRGCGRRFALKQPPEAYAKPPRCPHCGSIRIRNVEVARQREVDNQIACDDYSCPVPFKHRKASTRFCVHHPDFDQEWTRDDEEDWKRLVETPRSRF